MHSANMTHSWLAVSPFVAPARIAIRQFNVKILRALFGILYLGPGSLLGALTEEDRISRLRNDLPAHSESPPSIRLKSGGGNVISLPGRTRFRHSLKSGERGAHLGNIRQSSLNQETIANGLPPGFALVCKDLHLLVRHISRPAQLPKAIAS
jgi:hypothetical protein